MSFHHDEMLTISASVDSVRHIEGVVKMAAGEVRPVLFKKKELAGLRQSKDFLRLKAASSRD